MTQGAFVFLKNAPGAAGSPNGGPTTARAALHARFADRIAVDHDLTRRLVSYQGNKCVPGFRWMKYKEGFSVPLVERFLDYGGAKPARVLDPFSGMGTTALTASRGGCEATGIEVMQVGNLVARAIAAVANGIDPGRLSDASRGLLDYLEHGVPDPEHAFPHVRITRGAFSPRAEADIAKARTFISTIDNRQLALVLTTACVTAIEEISYTRKDGQYLRWDPRSGRTASTRLDKGPLPTLGGVLKRRLGEIADDLPVLKRRYAGPPPHFVDGSCLTELSKLPAGAFDIVITSPPYANRYDYTRTYALELAWLGYDEQRFKTLRQTLLSATVENHSKRAELEAMYQERSASLNRGVRPGG